MEPNDTILTAFNIGILTDPQSFNEFVGDADPLDYYRFTLTDDYREVVLSLTGTSERTRLRLIVDSNGNGLVDDGEDALDINGSGDLLIRNPLNRGTYFVEVSQWFSGRSTDYTLAFSQTDPPNAIDPGNTLETALDIGDITTLPIFNEFVGNSDLTDYYSFTFTDYREVNLSLTGTSERTRLRLISDSNNNGQVDDGETFQDVNGSGDLLMENPLNPGTYFVAVSQWFSGRSTFYSLAFSDTDAPNSSDPGNTLDTALDIGNLSGVRSFNEFVGNSDLTDYYRFSVTESSDVNLSITGISERTRLRLISDSNNNGEVDDGEILEDVNGSGDLSIDNPLNPGTYFVEVSQWFSDRSTDYTLQLTGPPEPKNDPDFNGDRNTDIIIRNPEQGWNGVWLMDGTDLINSQGLVTWEGWQPVATEDFNGDGFTDIIVNNPSEGWNGIWFMNGTELGSSEGLPTWEGWEIVDTGDFNDDGKADILIHNPSEGWNGIWLMDGTTIVDTVALPTWEGWKPVATGDLNSDSNLDIVINNPSEGWNGVWFLDDTIVTESAGIQVWEGWEIVGSADLNNDNASDLLINNPSENWNGVWFMDGATVTDSAGLPAWVDWQVIA